MTRILSAGRRVCHGCAIWGGYVTQDDGDQRGGWSVSGAATGSARWRRTHLDGAGLGPSAGGRGGGLPGISTGPAGVTEYGEVLRAGVGAVVAVPGAVRTRLGRGDVGELRSVPDLVAHRGRAGGRVDRAPWCPVCRVDDRRTAGRGVVLLRLPRAQRRGRGPRPAPDHPAWRRSVQAAAGTRRPPQGPPAGGHPGAPPAPSGATDLDAGADRADL